MRKKLASQWTLLGLISSPRSSKIFDKIISADTILTFLLQWEIEEERRREKQGCKKRRSRETKFVVDTVIYVVTLAYKCHKYWDDMCRFHGYII